MPSLENVPLAGLAGLAGLVEKGRGSLAHVSEHPSNTSSIIVRASSATTRSGRRESKSKSKRNAADAVPAAGTVFAGWRSSYKGRGAVKDGRTETQGMASLQFAVRGGGRRPGVLCCS
jgi:hypothetical protein